MPKSKPKAKSAPSPASGPTRKVVVTNRRARHDYEILERYEAGVELLGSEVKSLREGRCSLAEAYARVQHGEVWLHGMHIPPYVFSRGGGHEPQRPRKLLLHRREIEEIARETGEPGVTLVPLAVVFVAGLAKVELGVGRGKKRYDKRQDEARRDADREIARATSRRRRGGGPG